MSWETVSFVNSASAAYILFLNAVTFPISFRFVLFFVIAGLCSTFSPSPPLFDLPALSQVMTAQQHNRH
jgi:hypothetical protein